MCISLPLALIWLMLFATAVLSDKQSPEGYAGLIGGIIGGLVGGIIVIILFRKAQKTNDGIIEEISEENT